MPASGRFSLLASTLLACSLPLPSVVHAERLPIRTYSMVDGLPRNQIQHIMQDSRGYVWFCTSEGVSRFDGYVFRNYGESDGLPMRAASVMVETRHGDYFVGMTGGLFQFDPLASRRSPPQRPFSKVRVDGIAPRQTVSALCATRSGVIWCGTETSLYRLDRENERWRVEKVAWNSEGSPKITALLEDGEGTMWIGTSEGLFRRQRDGRCESWDPDGAIDKKYVLAAALDRWGSAWIGTHSQLIRVSRNHETGTTQLTRAFNFGEQIVGHTCLSVLATDGAVWVGRSAASLSFHLMRLGR